ncbi:MAG: biotin--[acetyl-CoA-carboxylase] ligase [Azoarcus sp.]|jgi:BirA family biotin operon repressor/biotin-[acetyl-CoA-carboxylase] ligase|nr:biotin--[acetyl-CoA-carboxylase] ligase [Azoarcus sp.]
MNAPSKLFPAPNLDAVNTALGSLAAAFSIRWVEECASTNSALLASLPKNDGRVHVLVTSKQNAGRGRRGRQWLTWPGASLTFSVLWRFAQNVHTHAGLSLAIGLALAQALEKLGLRAVALKWPNDLLVRGAKLSGILVEASPEPDRSTAVVIGIGLNLCLPADAVIPNQAGGATDLARELGFMPERETLLAAVLSELHLTLTNYARTGFGPLRDAWQRRNAFANLPVQVIGEGYSVSGLCLGVDENGTLLVQCGTEVCRVFAGDVSVRPIS